MKRRDFLKQASMAALATGVVPLGAAGKRIAFGGIQIECSTYGNILSRMEDFTVRRGQALADYRLFAVTKDYPHPFMPVFLASAVPGGRVERADVRRPEGGVPRPAARVAAARRRLPADARRDVRRRHDGCRRRLDLRGARGRRRALPDLGQLRSARQPEPPRHRQPRHAVGVPDRAAHRPRRHAQARLRHAGPLPRRGHPADAGLGAHPGPHARRTQQHGVRAGEAAVGPASRPERAGRRHGRLAAGRLRLGRRGAGHGGRRADGDHSRRRCTRPRRSLAQQYWDARTEFSLRRPDGHDGRGDREGAGASLAARGALGLGRQPDRRRHGRPRRRARRAAADEGPRRGARGHRGSAGDRGVLPGRGRADAHAEDRREPRSSGQHSPWTSRPGWCSWPRPTGFPNARR